MLIFVQIASYRDPQLIPTVKDMLQKAKRPDQLRFGICRQFHPKDGFDDIKPSQGDPRFRMVHVPWAKSQGACWARNISQRLYGGEEFTLQIDSHMRFAWQWDETLIEMTRRLQAGGIRKPLLTGYASAFDPRTPPHGDEVTPPLQMRFSRFSPGGAMLFGAEVIPGWQRLSCPVFGRFFSGHFCFTMGSICHEVPYDPDLYFHGEEITMAVRAYTHGYDLFHPHKMPLWHYYQREKRAGHWDDHDDWTTRDEASLKRTRQLLGVDNEAPNQHFGKFGLGAVRSLRDYERYAGIVFAKRIAQK